jgi:pyruvate-ferredoxin/flavodoxin oxidoreductase
MHLDSAAPSIPYKDFIRTEARFDMLWQTHPDNAEKFLAQAQRDVNHRYHYYQQLAELDWSDSISVAAVKANFKHAAKEI